VALEDFRVPKTPETRTPYVLGLLAILGAANAALRWFVEFRYAVDVSVVIAAAAVAWVVFRFLDQHPAKGQQ
jgi:hypothetical protein